MRDPGEGDLPILELEEDFPVLELDSHDALGQSIAQTAQIQADCCQAQSSAMKWEAWSNFLDAIGSLFR